MLAAVIHAAGAAPVATEFAEPTEPPGHQVVEVVAAGLHPVVRALVSGQHYGSDDTWPQIPGVDAVARTATGGLVYAGYTPAPYGTFAQRMAVPMAMPLPAGADPVVVAAGMNPGLSSWLPLQRYAGATPPDTVLVLGATGSAGRLAVQNARILGATTVIAVGRDAGGLTETERLGATLTVRLDGADDAAAIADVLATHPPTIVLDFLWGAPAEATLQALTGRGMQHAAPPVTYVEIGESAGATVALSGGVLRSRAITIVGSGGGSVRPADIATQVPAYAELLTSGRVQIPTTTYALSEVATAWTEHSSASRAVITP